MTALKIRPITKEELAAYYAGGKRKMIDGVPCRVAAHVGKAPGKDVIEACAKMGAGIDYMPEASRFRFTPPGHPPRECGGKPSARGNVSCGNGNRWKLKNWTPAKLSAAPQYNTPMAGDDWELTDARKKWHNGDSAPLAYYLAKLAAERRTAAAIEAEPIQLALAA